jgi:anti-anti-sigma factor
MISSNTKIVRLEGRVDGGSVPELLENTQKLLLDLSKVNCVSSAGMRFLLQLIKRARLEGRVVSCIGMQGEVKELVQKVGFEKVFTEAI